MKTPAEWQIVLIDDEADIREVMAITLEDAGYRVFAAENGLQGLQLVEELSPQIVITDVRMPGLDGIQVLESLKQRHPDIEVIVATAFGEMNLAIRALQLDASDFINKPINDEALHMALQRAQARHTERKQLRDYTKLLEAERAQTVQELVKSVAFQKNLIESSMDGILGSDGEGRVVIFNRSMEQLLGIPREEVLQKAPFERFFPPGEAARLRREMAGDGYGGSNRLMLFETTLLAKDGQRVPVRASATVLFDQAKEAGWVFFFGDLRRIRRLERDMQDKAEILHQDKMMALGRLAASVVHEINNPLSGILNYLRLMIRILNRGPLDAAGQQKFFSYLDLVEKETDRCSRIVSGLLTFSRKSPPSLGRVDVADLLNRCLLLSKHKLELSRIELVTRIAENIPPVAGDVNQLQQSVINLVFNAIDAMPDGGRLTIGARYDSMPGQAVIWVTDTGKGISQQDLPHIFEPFFTTKKEGYGLGLGLSTVFGIMQHHHGSVDVESTPGAGATFFLKIPA